MTDAPGPATARVRAARVRAALALLFAAVYSTWLAEAVVDDGVSAVWGFVSELSARTEPHGTFFAVADGLAGILAVSLAVAWWLRRPPGCAAAAGLTAWGSATILDALARMPSVEITPDRLGPLPGRPDGPPPAAAPHAGVFGPHAGQVHVVTSSVAQVGLVVAIVGLLLAVPWLRRGAGRVLAWGALAASAATIASAALFELAGVNPALGVWQRAGLLAAVAVVAAAGVADLRDARGGPGAAGPAPGPRGR